MHGQRTGDTDSTYRLDFRSTIDKPGSAGDHRLYTVEVTVTNSISRDQGYFKISKVFGSTAYTGDFAMNYDCTDAAATTGYVDLAQARRAPRSARSTPTTA